MMMQNNPQSAPNIQDPKDYPKISSLYRPIQDPQQNAIQKPEFSPWEAMREQPMQDPQSQDLPLY